MHIVSSPVSSFEVYEIVFNLNFSFSPFDGIEHCGPFKFQKWNVVCQNILLFRSKIANQIFNKDLLSEDK